MDAEIRPISDDEVDAFLRVIPSVAGLPMWEPDPVAWWSGPGVGPVFGGTPSPADLRSYRSDLTERDRTQAAFVAGKLAGTSLVLSLELTIPGRGPVPMGGVTAVGVLPTHRRQGLLRGMMRAVLDNCRDRGEMLAALNASEGGIYGRFGFGPATFQVRWELDRTRAALAQRPENRGQVELVGAADATAAGSDCTTGSGRAARARSAPIPASGITWPGRRTRATMAPGPSCSSCIPARQARPTVPPSSGFRGRPTRPPAGSSRSTGWRPRRRRPTPTSGPSWPTST